MRFSVIVPYKNVQSALTWLNDRGYREVDERGFFLKSPSQVFRRTAHIWSAPIGGSRFDFHRSFPDFVLFKLTWGGK